MKNLYVVAIHSVRVDESRNGDYTKQGHNRIKKPAPMSQFVAEWRENPDWEVGQIVEISSYRSVGEGYYGGHTYRKIGAVIHHYALPESVLFPQGMPEPTPFEDLDIEAKQEHNEALDRMAERGHSLEEFTYFKLSDDHPFSHNPKLGEVNREEERLFFENLREQGWEG